MTEPSSRIYLDNAATSWPKPNAVWDAVSAAGKSAANAGRGGYASALAAAEIVDRARLLLARRFGGAADRTVLTLNATDALNMAIKGILRAGDHVVTSSIEHNSVRRPLAGLAAHGGITVTEVGADRDARVDAAAVVAALTPATRLVALTHASNVTGVHSDIESVAAACRERGVLFLVDAAQTAGAVPIDIDAIGIDLLAIPGHKGLLGPLGTGALLVGARLAETGADWTPWREGGTGTSSQSPHQPETFPERLEAGSPNVPGIAGLVAALEYLDSEGASALAERTRQVAGRLLEGLLRIDGVEVDGPRHLDKREPLFPIRVDGWQPEDLAAALDAEYGIEVRAGLHCAPGAHEAIGSSPAGSVRLSPGPFTPASDVDVMLEALREFAGDGG